MNILIICVPYLLLIVLIFSGTKVAAQEGPGIVIAHPGQDVELLCTVTVTSGNQAAWLVNNVGPYRINALRSGILPGHSATLGSNNLIVENIMMNDDRNDSDYRCVIVPVQSMITVADIIDESDPTILYVAGIPAIVPNVTVDDNTININGNIVTLTLSWREPFNNLDPIVNYTVSCSGDVTCPPNFTTTDNTTRSYTITNLTPMTNYTFSVVATNSVGSGEAGAVMITTPPGQGEGINTTTSIMNMPISTSDSTTTSSMGMTATTTTTSSVGMTATTSSVSITATTSSVGMTATSSSVGMTTITSSVGMTTTTTTSSVGGITTTSSVDMTITTSSVDMTTTTTTTSSVGMITTTSSVGMTITTSSVDMTTTTTTTSSVGMITTTSSVGMPISTSSEDASISLSSVGMTISATTTTTTTTTTSSMGVAGSCDCGSNATLIGAVVGVDCVVIIIIVITNIMVWIYCFRKRHHTGTSLKLQAYGPTEDTVNPAYIVTNQHYKESELAEEPNDDYEEVNKPPGELEVKMTPNPAYAVP